MDEDRDKNRVSETCCLVLSCLVLSWGEVENTQKHERAE
jgi:hypothetical protein